MIIGQDIVHLLEDLGYEVVDFVHDFDTAIHAIESLQPDICLLDIEIDGDKDGIDLANYIRANHHVPFIYLTSNADFTTLTRAKETSPSGYIMKPIHKNDLLTSIEIALASTPTEVAPKSTGESVFLQEDQGLVKVAKDDILWLKAEGNYTGVYTAHKRYLIRGNLKEINTKLGSSFFRVHRSFCIRLDKIEMIRHDVVIINNTEIPVGKSYRSDLQKSIETI
jgi:DNA-binding LytR/AlgR family response regulator